MNILPLFGESWGNKLKPFLLSKEFKAILSTLKTKSSQAGIEIFPKLGEVFKPFNLCSFEETKVVFLGTNPYYEYKTVADGLLFSSKSFITNLEKLVFRAVENNYDKKGPWHDTLNGRFDAWAKQGVLMLPLDLTMEKDVKGAHIKLWGPFIEAVFRALGKDSSGVIYVLLGSQALPYAKYVDAIANDIISLEHPAKSLALHRNWKHKNVFNYIDRVTNMIHNKKINWFA